MSVVLPRLLADLPHLPRAACRDRDPELWFSDRPADRAAAVAVCAGCPERETCLAWAIERRVGFGVWGGLTANQRGTASHGGHRPGWRRRGAGR